MENPTKDETVVLSGIGPSISLRMPDYGKITILSNDQVKTITVNGETKVTFAA
jgi:hypothetical protein